MNIPGYELALPDKATAMQILTEAFDSAEAERLWLAACVAIPCPVDTLELTDLQAIYHYFSKQSGRLAVHGMSLKVRLMTYRNLLILHPPTVAQ